LHKADKPVSRLHVDRAQAATHDAVASQAKATQPMQVLQ